jgi:hypothetical protein
MKIYNIKPGLEEFSLAREQFTKIVNFLISDSAKKLEHGDIEEKIMKEGWEILRLLLQGHLDLRANEEEKSNSIKTPNGILLNPTVSKIVIKLSASGEQEWYKYGLYEEAKLRG